MYIINLNKNVRTGETPNLQNYSTYNVAVGDDIVIRLLNITSGYNPTISLGMALKDTTDNLLSYTTDTMVVLDEVGTITLPKAETLVMTKGNYYLLQIELDDDGVAETRNVMLYATTDIAGSGSGSVPAPAPEGSIGISGNLISIGIPSNTIVDSTIASNKVAIKESSSSFTEGSIIFSNGSGQLTEDNAGLKWDGTNHQLLLNGRNIKNEFDIRDYGAVVDGVTDDSAAVLSAITAIYENKGGTLYFPAGITRMNSCLSFPFNVQGQPPIRIRGEGSIKDGVWGNSWVNPIVGGSIIDIRYDGTDLVHPAKIDTRSRGLLDIDGVTFKSGGTDNFPFFQTTSTTVNFGDDVAFWGNDANAELTCQQDAIFYGGHGTTYNTGAKNDSFQGYGAVCGSVFFHKIRACVTLRNNVNSIDFDHIIVSDTCGGSGAHDAPIVLDSGFGFGSFNNRFWGGTIEIRFYKHTVAILGESSQNKFYAVGSYDPTPGTYISHYYISDLAYARDNYIDVGFGDTTYPVITGNAAKWQTVIDSRPGEMKNTFQNAVEVKAQIPYIELTGTQAGGGGVDDNKQFKIAAQWNDSQSMSIIDVSNGNAQRMYIRNDGNIGINTTTPAQKLTVNGDLSVIRPNYNYIGALQSTANDITLNVFRSAGEGDGSSSPGTVLRIGSNEGSGYSAYTSIIAGSTGEAGLNFGDYTNDRKGSINVSNSNSNIIFRMENVEKMRIKANTINFSSLPTSASGLSSGDLWSDGGTLKIVS